MPSGRRKGNGQKLKHSKFRLNIKTSPEEHRGCSSALSWVIVGGNGRIPSPGSAHPQLSSMGRESQSSALRGAKEGEAAPKEAQAQSGPSSWLLAQAEHQGKGAQHHPALSPGSAFL